MAIRNFQHSAWFNLPESTLALHSRFHPNRSLPSFLAGHKFSAFLSLLHHIPTITRHSKPFLSPSIPHNAFPIRLAPPLLRGRIIRPDGLLMGWR